MVKKFVAALGFSSFLATLTMLVLKAFGLISDFGYVDVFAPMIITTTIGLFLRSLSKLLTELDS